MGPESSTRRRRLLAIAVLTALAALLAFAAGASANAIIPENGGSPNANDISSLYEIVLLVAAIIFVGVEGALIYSLVKFRARKGRVAAQIHGNTRLEIGWTVGATVILVALAVFTFTKLGSIRDPARSGSDSARAGGVLYASIDQPPPPDSKALTIEVNGQQYIWRYTYDNGHPNLTAPYSYTDMYVPADTTIILNIRGQDVIHSWWIPSLGGKFDAVPGYTNKTWFKASKVGAVYSGQCAELCGRNHANMLARVHVLSPSAFQAWLTQQKNYIQQANNTIKQQRVSHTGPGASLGNIGP